MLNSKFNFKISNCKLDSMLKTILNLNYNFRLNLFLKLY